MQTALFNSKEVQKKDILRLGQSLYNKAMKDARAIVEQNKHLRHENLELTADNTYLKQRIASIDGNAIAILRDEKNEEIAELQKQLERANTNASRSNNIANRERQRADNAENQVMEMLAIPEIRQTWDTIQQNKQAFWKQIDLWIKDGVAAIEGYAARKDNDFQPDEGNAVAWGIIAEAFLSGLDPADVKQRKMSCTYLLEKVSWIGVSEFKASLTANRTQQLCGAMTVPPKLMDNLLLAAGGRGGFNAGGGSSNNELTNWNGTKKKTGWGR